jgi:hypothetical protein
VREFTDDVRNVLVADREHIAMKLAQDPSCRLTPQPQKLTGKSPNSPTAELLGMSLVREPKL